MGFGTIKHMIYTPELESSTLICFARESGIDCISVIDARSAVYVATGISAQNKEIVAVCLDSSNVSRSAFSGMTEAYYRNLPIVLITYGKKLDYSKELNDVVNGHYKIHSIDQIESLLGAKLPVHIELQETVEDVPAYDGRKLYQFLRNVLDSNDYLYVGQCVNVPNQALSCKVIKGGMPDCLDGAMANLLGASLVKKHKRYIGLISEEEYIHDMNTLGNIHINDSLMFVVIVRKENAVLEDYAKSLDFTVCTAREGELSDSFINSLVCNGKKTVLFVLQEKGNKV